MNDRSSYDVSRDAMTEEQIQSLVSQAQSGNSGSVARLFELFSDRIFRFFRIRLSNVETAEDLTQTVFLEMIQALERYVPRANAKFSTWLFQIARFRLIDHYRKYRPVASLDDPVVLQHPNTQTAAHDYELPETDAYLQRLPEKYQTVLHLRFREDLSAAEIARVLQTTPLNVRVIQHRALRALRKLMSNPHR